MNQFVLTESDIHYVKGFLERYSDKYPTKHHQDTLKEFTKLSDKLLETLEEPFTVNLLRHKITKKR